MSYDLAAIFVRITSAVECNPGITLSEMASLLGTERHTVERACRMHGTSFRILRQRARFLLACELLRNRGEQSIKQVSAAVGYSPRAFARFVGVHSGMTPNALRRALQASGQGRARLSDRADRGD